MTRDTRKSVKKETEGQKRLRLISIYGYPKTITPFALLDVGRTTGNTLYYPTRPPLLKIKQIRHDFKA